MPRVMKITARDIQKARANWYQFHYEKRAKFKALSINEQHIYEHAAFRIPPPTLTIYGGLPGDYPTSADIRTLMSIQGMRDTDLANPWYVSEAGWQEFQELWQQLPEPVDLSTEACVQKYPLVHIVHNPKELTPSRRA